MSACPHCHLPLPTEPGSGAWPAHCPRCGQALGEAPARAASIASLLRAPPQGEVGHFTRPAPSSDPPAPPAAPAADAPRAVPEHLSTEPTAAAQAAVMQDPSMIDPESRDSTATEAPTADTPQPAPSFLRTAAPVARPPVPGWQWAILAALGALLALQLLVADRARLAQDAAWRPTLERLCGALRCTLPAWQQPRDYTMLTRDVQPMADAAGMLRVRATFRNDAPWPQPWPAIVLSLSDADGRVTGARALLPSDYLEPGLRGTTLAPGQSGQMTVPVREPDGGAVAFAFEFR
ncbi:DUF3426 domain-containing protein [Pseudoxanthomonas winnipegensis]|uniref:DUF3426 domain-containing protein n=1 Tax=Pseudoxanthomonas winnipegensis TaxID=2480810 RepID=UPI002578B49A|nr:DUF3426 domain-containing protein [Pseudoxanthomonas winnipegensis]WJI15135.1 DUF3426 domain-containing protein [Pseudoxanthomonas winnipegensis]